MKRQTMPGQKRRAKRMGMKLADLVAEKGEVAVAEMIGTNKWTVSRWLNGHFKPRGLYKAKVLELGIELEADGSIAQP